MDYSVVIPLGPNDIDFFRKNFQMSRKNLPSTIYVITRDPIEIEGCTIVLEDRFPFDKSEFTKFGNRWGWYYQQLLKIYSPIVLQLDKFVILDADTILLKPIDFFKDNKIQFNVGTEHHIPYFQHMKKILPSLEKSSSYSGICHLMPMKRSIVEDLITRVEVYHTGTPFWRVMIDNVLPSEYGGSGMSEYEILFIFAMKFYSTQCVVNKLKWKNLNNVSQITPDLDYASIHWYCRE